MKYKCFKFQIIAYSLWDLGEMLRSGEGELQNQLLGRHSLLSGRGRGIRRIDVDLMWTWKMLRMLPAPSFPLLDKTETSEVSSGTWRHTAFTFTSR